MVLLMDGWMEFTLCFALDPVFIRCSLLYIIHFTTLVCGTGVLFVFVYLVLGVDTTRDALKLSALRVPLFMTYVPND